MVTIGIEILQKHSKGGAYMEMGLAKYMYCIKPDPNKLPHKTLK